MVKGLLLIKAIGKKRVKVMKFFMSSESDGRYDDFEEPLRIISNEIEDTIKPFIEERSYGEDVTDISIISVIIKPDLAKEGWFKERVLFKRKAKDADLRLRIDYDKFVKGNDEIKRLLLIDNITKSIGKLSVKTKDFDSKKLQEDILSILNVTWEELKL